MPASERLEEVSRQSRQQTVEANIPAFLSIVLIHVAIAARNRVDGGGWRRMAEDECMVEYMTEGGGAAM